MVFPKNIVHDIRVLLRLVSFLIAAIYSLNFLNQSIVLTDNLRTILVIIIMIPGFLLQSNKAPYAETIMDGMIVFLFLLAIILI